MINSNALRHHTQSQSPAGMKQGHNGTMGYEIPAREKLARLVYVGSLHPTFYASESAVIQDVMELIAEVAKIDRPFLAKAAVLGSKKNLRRDIVAMIVTYLICNAENQSQRAEASRVFETCIKNGKMLSNVFAILRSGICGAKSMSSFRRKLFSRWLDDATITKLMNASVNNTPSLKDIILLARPKFTNDANYEAKISSMDYFLGNAPYYPDALPEQLIRLSAIRAQHNLKREGWKYKTSAAGLPWMALKDLTLTDAQFKEAIDGMSNVEFFNSMATLIRRCSDSQDRYDAFVAKLREVFKPGNLSRIDYHRFISAHTALRSEVPEQRLLSALARTAINDYYRELGESSRVSITGRTLVAIDRSGSMSNKVNPKSATSRMVCAMGLASNIVPCGYGAKLDVILFNRRGFTFPNEELVKCSRDVAYLDRVNNLPDGGTDCGVVWSHLAYLRALKTTEEDVTADPYYDNIIIISDDESHGQAAKSFEDMQQYLDLVNPHAKVICLDVSPRDVTSLPPHPNVTRIGGFGTEVLELLKQVVDNPESLENSMVRSIEQVRV